MEAAKRPPFVEGIKADLEDSHINWRVALSFIPIAFFTYLFHESGHWLFGQLTGNEMLISLNNSTPESGYFIRESDALWSAIGGPVFTILQAFIFLVVTEKTKSVYAFSVVFFAFFCRSFSIILGGLSLQDEARIASMLNINEYLLAGIVLWVLFIITWRASRIMNLGWKASGYFTALSTGAMLLVIWTNWLIY
ncbi:hypothetical protein [Gracilimonas mengyeensis]|uniref:Peptidase M50B-like n=1 Tax=Gracilimonas mengyeensis TaxID=1302730 RepID=A0A521EGI6_9BACT|nr:hypothetical protein [Gracilimonas mengyeensis]SMO82270.1 hypothetical protein SAMN06265219_111153 [Gracilimonas mengyeensis]